MDALRNAISSMKQNISVVKFTKERFANHLVKNAQEEFQLKDAEDNYKNWIHRNQLTTKIDFKCDFWPGKPNLGQCEKRATETLGHDIYDGQWLKGTNKKQGFGIRVYAGKGTDVFKGWY